MSFKEEKPACFILTKFERTLHLPATDCKDQSQDACYPSKYLPFLMTLSAGPWVGVYSSILFDLNPSREAEISAA